MGKTSIDDFTAYIDKCTDSGFSVDYDKGDKFYRASDKKGNQLSLTYEGNQIMAIQIEKPEKTRKKKTKAKKEEPAAVETEAAPESEPPAETEAPDNSAESADGMRPEFKAAMDSYEAFMNEYCDFMARYAQSDGRLY